MTHPRYFRFPGDGFFTACFPIGCLALTLSGCPGVSDQARQQAQAMVNLGRVQYAEEHNPRGAIDTLQQALRLDPQSAEGHLCLGQVFVGHAHAHELTETPSPSSSSNPPLPPNSTDSQDFFARAETELRRAITLFAEHVAEDDRDRAQVAEARNTLAYVLLSLHRYDEAIALATLAADEVLYASRHLALGNLGVAQLRKGLARQAITSLERAVAVQPRYCAGRYHLADAYFRVNDMAHALESLNRTMSSPEPECSTIQEAFLLRARVHLQLHQTAEAQTDLSRCVELMAQSETGRACASLRTPVTPVSPVTSGALGVSPPPATLSNVPSLSPKRAHAHSMLHARGLSIEDPQYLYPRARWPFLMAPLLTSPLLGLRQRANPLTRRPGSEAGEPARRP